MNQIVIPVVAAHQEATPELRKELLIAAVETAERLLRESGISAKDAVNISFHYIVWSGVETTT